MTKKILHLRLPPVPAELWPVRLWSLRQPSDLGPEVTQVWAVALALGAPLLHSESEAEPLHA